MSGFPNDDSFLLVHGYISFFFRFFILYVCPLFEVPFGGLLVIVLVSVVIVVFPLLLVNRINLLPPYGIRILRIIFYRIVIRSVP